MPLWLQIVAAVTAVASMVSIGGLFEARAGFFRLEVLRLAGFPFVLYLFVAHAGAPIWLIAVGVANLVAIPLLVRCRGELVPGGRTPVPIPV